MSALYFRDGWMCTFTIQQQLEMPSARSWAAAVRADDSVRKTGGTACPLQYKPHPPGHSPLALS